MSSVEPHRPLIRGLRRSAGQRRFALVVDRTLALDGHAGIGARRAELCAQVWSDVNGDRLTIARCMAQGERADVGGLDTARPDEPCVTCEARGCVLRRPSVAKATTLVATHPHRAA